MSIELLRLAQGLKVRFDGERDNSWRTIGKVVGEAFVVDGHIDVYLIT